MPGPGSHDDCTTLLGKHRIAFYSRMGEGPQTVRLFFSPGRVNLFGGHLDYNGGPVMPTAIDRGTFLAIRPREDGVIHLQSRLDSQGLEFVLGQEPRTKSGRWVDYPVGVIRELLTHWNAGGAARPVCGLDILYGGNLPVGAGLSSSASICVGTAFALNEVWQLGLDRRSQVQCALDAEREFVGVQCGIMDPFAIGLAKPGHLLWLDCKDESFEHLPIDFEELSIVVANSGVQRELAAGEFNKRVMQCSQAFEAMKKHVPGAKCMRDVDPASFEEHRSELEPVLEKRATHVVAEVVRTFAARQALVDGDYERLGQFMTETHRSLRDNFEVSSPELDLLVEAALEVDGCYGSRLTGAGFGGCTVIMAHPDAVSEVAAHVRKRYSAEKGWMPDVEVFHGDEGPREVSL
ncbi:MAG: galactokinase [Planctomycetota bacterium]|nr:galactokinase [Planctomycetota bacterium]